MNSSERHARQRVRSHKDNRKRGAVRAVPACRSADVWLTKPPSSATTARTPTIVVRLDGLPPSTRYFIGIGLSSRRTVMGIFLMRNVFLLATLAFASAQAQPAPPPVVDFVEKPIDRKSTRLNSSH